MNDSLIDHEMKKILRWFIFLRRRIYMYDPFLTTNDRRLSSPSKIIVFMFEFQMFYP